MELLSALSAHWLPVLIGLVVAIGLAYVVWRFLRDKPASISFLLQILNGLETYLKDLLGERWAPVYDAILDAGEAAVDGAVTQDEAKRIARNTFNTSLQISGVTLTNEQKTACHNVLDILVTILMRDKPAASVALMKAK